MTKNTKAETRRARILRELAVMQVALKALDVETYGAADFDSIDASLSAVNIIGAAARCAR